jgi:hypothetical protein
LGLELLDLRQFIACDIQPMTFTIISASKLSSRINLSIDCDRGKRGCPFHHGCFGSDCQSTALRLVCSGGIVWCRQFRR